MDVRNLDELEADGNLGVLGATNWVHIPIPELETALELDNDEFEERYNYPKFTFDDQVRRATSMLVTDVGDEMFW